MNGFGVSDRLWAKPLVDDMLARLREAIRCGNYEIENRRKNMAFLADHGYTIKDQEDILATLTYEDFIKSDIDKDDETGNDIYWFFKPVYDGHKVYVKYKIPFYEQWPGFAFIKSLHDDEV